MDSLLKEKHLNQANHETKKETGRSKQTWGKNQEGFFSKPYFQNRIIS